MKSSRQKEEFIPEFKLRASSLRSTANNARSSEKENFLAPRQRSASELKTSFRSAVLSPNRFENRKKVFDNPSVSSRKRFANRERVVPKIEPPQFSHNKMEMIKNRFEGKTEFLINSFYDNLRKSWSRKGLKSVRNVFDGRRSRRAKATTSAEHDEIPKNISIKLLLSEFCTY